MKKNNLILLMLLSGVLSASAVDYEKDIKEYYHQIKTKEQDLKNIETELQKIQILRDQCIEDEDKIKSSLNHTEKELSDIRARMTGISNQFEQLKNKKQELQNDCISAEILKNHWRNKRAGALHDFYLDYIVSRPAGTKDHLRHIYKKTIINRQQERIELADAQYAYAGEKAQKVLEEQQKLRKKISEGMNEKNILVTQKNKQREQYQQARNKYLEAEKEKRQLEESSAMLKAFIRELEDRKNESEEIKSTASAAQKEIARVRGHLPWPMIGDIVSPFGIVRHPTLNTDIHNNGIEIRSMNDSSVHAVAEGKVVFAGNFGGFGTMIIIDHRNGLFSVYGRLENLSVKKNQQVAMYEVIGSVKDRNGVLYFEIREKEKPANPLAWLQKK